jgi:PhnB protein
MSKPAANPIPAGFHALTPYLVCKGAADAIDFYTKAFGAEEKFRLPGPDGKIVHACLQVGDSPLMISDECPEMGGFSPQHLGGSPVTIHFSVADADATFARAIAAGAKPVMPVSEMFWGARYGLLQDPFGHFWSVATQVRDLTPEEITEGMRQAMAQCSSAAA